MHFYDMLCNIITNCFTSPAHVFHKKRKGQVVQKSASHESDFDEKLRWV